MTEVLLHRAGLLIGTELVPMLAGAVHYWQLERSAWRPALEALVGMGLRLVDTYVPWGVHEHADGSMDFGARRSELDVAAFLRLAREVGLYAIVRPGPHINAELTYFGIPERVIWDPACQARGPDGDPVVLPMLPRMFPVPSYASEAYLDEVTRFFHRAGTELAPLRYPDGPIVLLQIDNEGSLFFRDGVYDQDYHPDAIAKYRAFLRERYGTLDRLRAVYPDVKPPDRGDAAHLGGGQPGANPGANPGGEEELRFANVWPPKRLDVERPEQLCRHLDWAAFQEQLLTSAMQRFGRALSDAGLADVVTMHNLPMAQDATPLNAARLGRVVDLVGLDYYHRAAPKDRAIIARRTSELAVRSEALGAPAFACEMGAGYPFFFPPLAEHDSAFALLCAMAYGLRGYNLYMAVERDRWIGAPVDRRGNARPLADFYRRLSAAFDRWHLAELTRHVPVRLVVPRAERRLARVLHAFGPASAALLAVSGYGPREGCLEHDVGLECSPVDSDTMLLALEQALDARGVPFAVVGGEDRALVLSGARWIVCVTSGVFSAAVAGVLADAAAGGARLSMGPSLYRRDETMAPCDGALLAGPALEGAIEHLAHSDPASMDEAVARAALALDLPRYPCDPDGIHATVHHDREGALRVVFVINPGSTDVVARVALGCDAGWEDVLDGDATTSVAGTLEVRMRPASVRVFGRVG